LPFHSVISQLETAEIQGAKILYSIR
jgi:hypothetical protein